MFSVCVGGGGVATGRGYINGSHLVANINRDFFQDVYTILVGFD